MGNTFSRTRRASLAPVKPSEPRILIIGAGITGRKYSPSAVVFQILSGRHYRAFALQAASRSPPVIFQCNNDLEPAVILAQALKQHDIPFTVFERDPSVSARGRGWGLTIHWSLDDFVSLLPQHLLDRLPETYVNPSATERGENGNFIFFDLRSGEARWKTPPSKRIRVSRERLRALLLEGLDVQVS